ncbi:nucleotidyltransferase domain-containing protein [Clostridium sp. NSJ-6]|uniref:Nucleotidyltransferase domain-containing protein n=1 Tax=Clostridium hominis TaxID=2763036 RepID=A0ABR7D9U4_9CLOT|nr:nucleotidyltransferase domain-containing protein [Clostridium hominis]MBC5628164.1 nucleotidyltransferase domain-containing protein [Clostridium hominis]
MNLDKIVLNEIIEISKKYSKINKVILFGSRARGDNGDRSDIDLAIYCEESISDFIEDIENNTTTLLEFDFSDMKSVNDELFIEQVNKEGIILYEKY